MCKNGTRASSNDDTIVSVDTLNSQIRHYLVQYKLHGPPDYMLKGGYIDAEFGIELTQDDVREETRSQEAERVANRLLQERNDIRDVVGKNIINERSRRYNHTVQVSNALRRVRRYGVSYSLPLSYAEHRLAIERILAERKIEPSLVEFAAVWLAVV